MSAVWFYTIQLETIANKYIKFHDQYKLSKSVIYSL